MDIKHLTKLSGFLNVPTSVGHSCGANDWSLLLRLLRSA
uniref:Uncharacterized protein n=1 Tax=Arundo donax TaxID=35708 RepID=A0A0A9GWG4_ARUDO